MNIEALITAFILLATLAAAIPFRTQNNPYSKPVASDGRPVSPVIQAAISEHD